MMSGVARWALVPLALALLLGLQLAADGRLSGDEPGYLYAAAYQSVPQIIAGEVQPTGIPGFTQGRILHVLFQKGVMTMTRAGPEGFRALQVIHLAIVALNVLLIGATTRRLLPQVAEARAAILIVAMTPIVLYFALKTTADNEALLAALVATWGLLHLASRRGAAGPAAVVIGLVVAALTKNQMIFVPAAFWIAACLVPIDGMDRRRLALQGAAWGAAAGLVTVALLEALGIGVANYLESYASPFANQTPLVAKVMNLGTEFGLLWVVLPAALASHRRREFGFFALWFFVAMAPFLFLSGVEPRHVAVNLAATGGLAALALEAILRRWLAWHRIGDVGRAALATAGVLVLMACHAMALAIMPHKVDLRTLNAALSGLDARYGEGKYTLVASNGYADFHVLRVLWPERAVLNAGTSEFAIDTARTSRQALLEAYLGDRHVENVETLERIRGPAVFFGFRRTFAAANLEKMLSAVSPAFAARVLGGVRLDEHLYAGFSAWLWDSPEVRLEPILEAGNYQALEIRIPRRGE
jgi:hypothetical protein